jgi:hypothetical protein
MASTYAYTTLANIENLIGIDLSAVDATAFSDARVEAQITSAEKIVNAYFGETADQTDTDGIESSTVYITLKLIKAKMINLGYMDIAAQIDDLGLSIPDILGMFLNETKDDFVESIPMTGASYHKPDITY